MRRHSPFPARSAAVRAESHSARSSLNGRQSVVSTGRPAIAQACSNRATDAMPWHVCGCEGSAGFEADSAGVERQRGRCADSRACTRVGAHQEANPVAGYRSNHGHQQWRFSGTFRAMMGIFPYQIFVANTLDRSSFRRFIQRFQWIGAQKRKSDGHLSDWFTMRIFTA